LEPIFQTYDVDVVFQGYDANYERTHQIRDGEKVERGGIIYVTLGGGGRDLGEQAKNRNWSDVFKSKHHFAHINITGRRFKMQVYSINGDIIDELEITR